MNCIDPVTIKIPRSAYNDTFRVIQVPCGKCVLCKKDYQNSWMIRVVEQLKTTSKSIFVTLTYAQEHLPMNVDKITGECYPTVVKKHVQDWLKRFRSSYKYKYNKVAKFSYFLCSEYGPRTFRPHYHVIIIGLNRLDFNLALIDWQEKFGFTTCENVTLSTLKSLVNTGRYIGKYCSKGVFENPRVALGLVNPCFRLVSKGFGSTYVVKNKSFHLSGDIDQIVAKRRYYLNNFQYKLPRYYVQKIYSNHYLRDKITNNILAKSDALYMEKLQSVQTSISSDSPVSTLDMQEAEVLRNRYNESEMRTSQFLDKSKI